METSPTARPLGDRILGLAVGGDEADAAVQTKLRAFSLLLLAHQVAETAFLYSSAQLPRRELLPVLALVYLALLAWGLFPRWTRAATTVCSLLVIVQIVWAFPYNANHRLVVLLALALVSMVDQSRPAEARLALAGLRWMTVIVLFHTGWQKLTYGTYFHGDYLAYCISQEERFAGMFRLMIPTAEYQRLTAIGATVIGSGPYRVDSALFAVVSNLVYVLEMALPVLIVIRRTRALAVTAAIILFLFIEIGAREFFFGILFVNLLLLFYRGPINRLLLPLFSVSYVALLLIRYVVAPDWWLN